MTSRRAVLILGLGVLLVPRGAEATSISVRVTMPIVEVVPCCDSFKHVVPLGDLVAVTYEFDAETADADSAAQFGGFEGGLLSLTLAFPDVGLTFTTLGGGDNQVWTQDNATCPRAFPGCMSFGAVSDGLQLWLSGGGNGDRVAKKPITSIFVEFTADGQFPDLPTLLLDDRVPASQFRFQRGFMQFGNDSLSYEVRVPEPSTLLTVLWALVAAISGTRGVSVAAGTEGPALSRRRV